MRRNGHNDEIFVALAVKGMSIMQLHICIAYYQNLSDYQPFALIKPHQ